MLLNRLWLEAQERISENPQVTKRFLPQMQKEVRIVIGRDPNEAKALEEEKLKRKDEVEGDFSGVEIRRGGRLGRPLGKERVVR